MQSAISWIEQNFPNLQGKHEVEYRITSPTTWNYNCIAWAARDTGRWWWPDVTSYWPSGLPKIVTITNFVEAFRQLGYELDASRVHEPSCEKVALYAIGQTPTHMARQLESGEWTSKLGKGYDISHVNLQGVEGAQYGEVVRILKRLRIG